MKTGKNFKRKEIEQHKEVLPNGIFVYKVIKKNKKSTLNAIIEKETEKEINEYLQRDYSQE